MQKTSRLAGGSPRPNDDARIAVLDGWRAVSVALVIISHIGIVALTDASQRWGVDFESLLGPAGPVGVRFFFVISGYVITRGLLRERTTRAGNSLGAFYVRRSFRILPPLVLYILVVMAMAYAGLLPTRALGVATAATFTCNLTLFDCGGWHGGHMWSLSVEEQFYLFFPMIFVVAGMHSKMMSSILVLIVIALPIGGQFMGTLAFEQVKPFIAISLGVWWALHETEMRSLTRRIPQALVYVAPVVALAATALAKTRVWYLSEVSTDLLILLTLALSVYGASSLNRVLCLDPIRQVGRVSYGVYLWQQLALTSVPWGSPQYYVLTIAVSIAWAFVCFHIFEKPLIAIGARISERISKPRVSKVAAQV